MAITDPTDIAGLTIWLEADGAMTLVTGRLSQWTDGSAAANHFLQTVAGSRPLYVADDGDGMPAVDFEGSRYLTATFTKMTQPLTIFVVGRIALSTWNYLFDSNSGERVAIGRHAGSNAMTFIAGNDIGVAGVDAGWHTFTAVHNWSTSFDQRIDGVSISTSDTGGNGLDSCNLGANFGESEQLDGAIRAFIVYDALLTSGQITDVEAYLDAQWFGGGPPAAAPVQHRRRRAHLLGR